MILFVIHNVSIKAVRRKFLMNLILKRIYQGSVLLLILSFVGFSGVNQLVKAEFHYELILDEPGGIVELKGIESPTITIIVKSKSRAKVQLRASDIDLITKRLPSALIELKTDWGSFVLPANIINYTAWANKHEISLNDLLLQMTIEKIEDTDQIQAWKTKLGEASLISPIIRLAITLMANGEPIEVTDYNEKYISSILRLSGQKKPNELTAVGMDEATGKFSFKPALFQATGNQTIATIQTPHDGLFGVVSFHKSFTDLDHLPDKQDIELLTSKRVIQGVTATRFEPEALLTRASFISLLVRALGLKEATDPESAFTDISKEAWYAGAVGAAIKAGIAKGNTDATFGALKPITREQMAVMLSNALRFTNHTVNVRERADLLLADFTDSALISSWAIPAVEQVLDTGIMTSSTKTSFAPKEYMTRAEAAVIIKRFMQFVHFID
jgi:hypothetical protein